MPTAMMIVDVQNDIVATGHQTDAMLTTIAGLADRAREARVPIVYVRHQETAGPLQPGSAEWQIHDAVAPHPGEPIVDKQAADSFYGTDLEETLRAKGITHLVLTGLATDMCIDTTARLAQSKGYDVTVVSDGHSTGDYPGQLLSAADRIAYYNTILPYLPHPDHPIAVTPAAEVTFTQEP